MSAFYNENDPYAAKWLRNLIAAGLIAPGEVDERSISDIPPTDLIGFTQCHFFAGIGVWSYALRLAGWTDDRPVWTGSCPCQPFSAAGKRDGFADERHLWPDFFWLIRQRRPERVFGEQVAGKDGLVWLDAVWSDLESEGYAVGSVDLCAAGVGAPHIRQRLYWTAHPGGEQGVGGAQGGLHSTACQYRDSICGASDSESINGQVSIFSGRSFEKDIELGGCGRPVRKRGDADGGDAEEGQELSCWEQRLHALDSGCVPAGLTRGFWAGAKWLPCRDGKYRPTEPGLFPLAHGVANRVGRLRAYGNAIVPQVAKAFIEAAMEVRP